MAKSNAASAKPGAKAPAAKKEKKVRVKYSAPENAAWVNEDGKLIAAPEDFDPKANKPLQRKDFADEATFFEMQANVYEARAKRCREKAEESKKLGGAKDKQKAKKLISMTKRLNELKASLQEEGFDVDSLMASLNGADDEEAATASK